MQGAALGEQRQSGAQRDPGDAVALGEHPLRRQPVSGPRPGGPEVLPEPTGDLFVERQRVGVEGSAWQLERAQRTRHTGTIPVLF